MMIRERIGEAVKAVLIFPIKVYQKIVSPCLPPCCKYYPGCSAYAVEAIRRHGAVKGVILGSWRILRCNPWSRGGVDYVPEKFDLLYYKKEKMQDEDS
ncbi:MAG: membrane protein insertion efficiency factor YidD [Ruminococcus sp.]|nr:membrane protein insertion efficiency factor YidD [Ruminococcus sp.]